MSRSTKFGFSILILCQALHSIEETYFKLWEVLSPARYVASLFNSDLGIGFAVANTLIVLVGVLCAVYVFTSDRSTARFVVWVWVMVEFINSGVHTFSALASAAYFPGVYTAPLLFACSGYLTLVLVKDQDESGAT
jgi:hypothetical protein